MSWLALGPGHRPRPLKAVEECPPGEGPHLVTGGRKTIVLKTPMCLTLFIFLGSVYKVIGSPEYSHTDCLQRRLCVLGSAGKKRPLCVRLQRLEGGGGVGRRRWAARRSLGASPTQGVGADE